MDYSQILTYVAFIIGFILLIKGAGVLVDGASSLARRLKVSKLVIGLTVVAFGTSMPELFVNIMASAHGNTDLAIGNILGSNISNILLILGVAAIIYPLKIDWGIAWREIPLSLIAALLLFVMVNDQFIHYQPLNVLSRIDGLILLGIFFLFLVYILIIARKNAVVERGRTPYSISASIGLIILGLAFLIIGGKWIVDGAVTLAKAFGASESLIGLTIVAIGTSLPELATSAMAAYRKNSDIAIGNIVGSNIFNIFWILGISAIIKPLPFNIQANSDVEVLIATTILLLLFLFIGKRYVLKRWQGWIFVLSYSVYIIYLIQRG